MEGNKNVITSSFWQFPRFIISHTGSTTNKTIAQLTFVNALSLPTWNFGRLISPPSFIDKCTGDFRTFGSSPAVLYFGQRVCKAFTNMKRRNVEQRYAIKFCVKLSDSATETYGKLIKVIGDEALSTAQVFWWHKVKKAEIKREEGEAGWRSNSQQCSACARASKSADNYSNVGWWT